MMLTLVNVLIVWPLFWLVKTILLQCLIILFITILWRAYKTLLAGVRLPLVGGWLAAAAKLRPVEPSQAVLITGATSGIGLALSKHLFKSGYSILAAYYDSREPGLQELKQLASSSSSSASSSGLKQNNNRILFLELDVRNEESISRAYSQCDSLLRDHRLHLHALINNAGLGSLQPFAWLQRNAIRNLIDTNLMGNLLMTREFLPLLLSDTDGGGGRRRPGRLLFVSSGLGLVPGATYATYGITKAAQIYLAKSLNLELEQRYGIKSIAMVPHNFIKNTNICSLNVKQNELAWAELKPIERELFGRQFDEHVRLTKSLDEATRDLKSKAAKTTQQANKKPAAAAAQQINPVVSIVSKFVQFIKEVHDCLNGVNNYLSLEESGALECFETALRLENPPEIMFAGDSIFQLIVGSLLVSVPTSCSSLLGSTVAPSLYK